MTKLIPLHGRETREMMEVADRPPVRERGRERGMRWKSERCERDENDTGEMRETCERDVGYERDM